MRILLINAPVSRLSPHARISPPLGLAYLASYVMERGHEVEILDFNISGLNLRRVNAAMARFKPGLVGISAHTETYPNALKIAEQVKAAHPDTPVVMGGPHPSIMPLDVLAQDAVDFIVVGEGEPGFAGLIDALEHPEADLSVIPGLGYTAEGGPVVNERAEPGDPDAYPWPARDLFSLEFYADAFNVLTARGGCPYRCPFCSASFIWHGRHRSRAPKAVVDEMEMLIRNYGASFIFFVDDIFTLSRSWTVEFLQEVERLQGYVTWGCATRVDRVDEELLQAMAAHGCTGIQFGIESGAQSILDSAKGISKEAAEKAVQWSVAAGIRTSVSFMVPFPEDTEETIIETFDFIERLKDLGADPLLSYTSPYPGTLFYTEADQLGLTVHAQSWEEYDCKHSMMDTPNLSAERITQIVEERAERLGMHKSA